LKIREQTIWFLKPPDLRDHVADSPLGQPSMRISGCYSFRAQRATPSRSSSEGASNFTQNSERPMMISEPQKEHQWLQLVGEWKSEAEMKMKPMNPAQAQEPRFDR
jgi:hypothetical protein